MLTDDELTVLSCYINKYDALQDAYCLGVEAERKRCAAVCDDCMNDVGMKWSPYNALTAANIKKAIERGEDA